VSTAYENIDEHVWLSLTNAEEICKKIAEKISMVDSENKEIYEANLKSYSEKLLKLHNESSKFFSGQTNPYLIVADRFPFVYLFKEYNISYDSAFSGCTSETDATYENEVGHMAEFEALFSKYDRLVLFDTETTGLQYSRDEIIEFAAVVVEQRNGKAQIVQEYDELVSLSPGGFVPPKIQALTGISTQDILERGLSKTRVCRDIAEMFRGNTLLLAYNAHFDLSFLFYMLLRNGDPAILKGKDKLDLLTVYRDRRSFPHRLSSAIEAYGLTGKVVNSHRAIDDVIATVAVM
jgi:DNA polymerase-3 subunit epsilon